MKNRKRCTETFQHEQRAVSIWISHSVYQENVSARRLPDEVFCWEEAFQA